ncbi:MAG: DUF1684 domain-containing protein [Propionibacteriaceae bacterium]|nr:DUF1684 domain-containing protein [Propionibacteriaceae bacterium]
MTGPPHQELEKEWRAWWQGADAELAAEHGFLAATGLTWLTEEPATIAGIPGRWLVSGGQALVELGEGEALVIGDLRVDGETVLRVPTVRAGQPSAIRHGEVVIEVLERAEGVFVRPRDPRAPRRLAFTGTAAFPYDESWRRIARYAAVRPSPGGAGGILSLESVMPGLVNRYPRAGTVTLTIAGRDRELDVFGTRVPGVARLVFADLTNGVSSYRNGRYVDIELPPSDAGEVVVDFNRARSFPCSYTDAPTCPRPPARNALDTEVRAGARTSQGERS